MGRIRDHIYQHELRAAERDACRRGIRPGAIAALILRAALVCGGLRVVSAEETRNSRPAACHLLGGTWTIWNGWHCG
jgi:hypothetical protein